MPDDPRKVLAEVGIELALRRWGPVGGLDHPVKPGQSDPDIKASPDEWFTYRVYEILADLDRLWEERQK